jgi:hypothetical protein
MPIVPRNFSPSEYTYTTGDKKGTKKQKRREHLMIAGGREGPEIIDNGLRAAKGKSPKARTSRYVEGGSPRWTETLASDETPPLSRTQSGFLRMVQPQQLQYLRGLMRVSEMLTLANTAKQSPATSNIEVTLITAGRDLVSLHGELIDPNVDALVRDSTPDWTTALRRLAAELRAAQATLLREVRTDDELKAMSSRVYLNFGKTSIPVAQFAVPGAGSGQAAIAGTAYVTGLYTPSDGDDPVTRRDGSVVQPGAPIQIRADKIEFVTVDPPELRTLEFVDTPAFARARALVLKLKSDTPSFQEGRPVTLPAGQELFVPYSLIMRLRIIYPNTGTAGDKLDYTRRSSQTIESTESTARDIAVLKVHIDWLKSDIAQAALRGKYARKRKNQFVYVDEYTGLAFTLRGYGGTVNDAGRRESTRRAVAAALQPVLVWESDRDADWSVFAELRGRPVVPIDMLRVLRSTNNVDALRELRKRYRNVR